jgi:hypothetical protein
VKATEQALQRELASQAGEAPALRRKLEAARRTLSVLETLVRGYKVLVRTYEQRLFSAGREHEA